jgi:pyridoxine 5-phosphate synthase
LKLGVNVDHAATLRNARGTTYPDPVLCAMLCEAAGADSIVMHLREDRRHIKERDLLLLKRAVKIPINLEMAASEDIVVFALEYKPFQATLVPERRQELTTEGGLDLVKNFKKVSSVTRRLQDKGIKVSLFIDPSLKQVEFAQKIGAEHIEFHTGAYCDAKTSAAKKKELKKLKQAAALAKDAGFFVAAGHGINYENTKDIIAIKAIEELNIGHAIISRALYIGLPAAVEEMRAIIGR